MSAARLVWLIPALLSSTGCAGVVSLHPLAVPNGKDTVFEPALLGTWEEIKAESGGVKTRYTVERGESGYKVNAVAEAERVEGTMHLMKVGDRYLLDVLCPSNGAPPPVHLFLRLRFEKDVAWVSEMDTSWVKDQIETRRQPRHEVLIEGGEKLVFTASTAELRRHLLPLARDDRSFGEETELRRVK
jgi:hypothetical protein